MFDTESACYKWKLTLRQQVPTQQFSAHRHVNSKAALTLHRLTHDLSRFGRLHGQNQLLANYFEKTTKF